MPVDCPLFDGHGNVTARETFSAFVTTRALVRPLSVALLSLFGFDHGWQEVECRSFENAAFELGGGYRTLEMLKADKELEEQMQ